MGLVLFGVVGVALIVGNCLLDRLALSTATVLTRTESGVCGDPILDFADATAVSRRVQADDRRGIEAAGYMMRDDNWRTNCGLCIACTEPPSHRPPTH